MEHTILLADGTVGTITADSIDYQNPEGFIGEMINVKFYNENGHQVEAYGRAVEVLINNYVEEGQR